jgi:hypothetical protein
MPAGEEMPPDMAWAAVADGSKAIVVDLPGRASVAAGMMLAAMGYRPVALFNAIPDADEWPIRSDASEITPALVDVRPIVIALTQSTRALAMLLLAPDAPPAFLLDANRRGGASIRRPGCFDNRSVSLPTDFPSANLFLSRGIRGVIVVQPTGRQPQVDLAHTLRRWQEAGVQIFINPLDETGGPFPITFNRPSGFKLLWYNFLATIGLKRSPFGGFGGRLPSPSAG